MSGFAFALLQRSLRAIPGLFLLSLVEMQVPACNTRAFAVVFGSIGARQGNNGSLAVPIGMPAGILATCFFLEMSGFLNYPQWLTGTRPLQPLGGAVGVSLGLLLAVYLYQRQPPGANTITRGHRTVGNYDSDPLFCAWGKF